MSRNLFTPNASYSRTTEQSGISNPPIDFGDHAVGGPPAVVVLTIRNDGDSNLVRVSRYQAWSVLTFPVFSESHFVLFSVRSL